MSTPDQTPLPTTRMAMTHGLGRLFNGLSPREQRAIRIAAWAVGLGLLWWVGVSPALQTLRQAGARHAELDTQLARMQQQAASAEVLRTQTATPPPPPEMALNSLQAATPTLGAGAQVGIQGDRATITLQGTDPRALARWLNQVRVNARLTPAQAQLQRVPGSAGWSGQIVLAGPGLGGSN